MNKLSIFALVILFVFTLTSCKNNTRVIIFNIDDFEIVEAYVGDESIDLSFISAMDEEGMNLSPFLEYDGWYDLDTVGSYNITVFVYDNIGTYGEVKIIINVLELTCAMDNTQEKCLIPVVGLSFRSDSISLDTVYEGDFIKLNWDFLPLDASNKNITITSSDESIATVSVYGYVFGIAEGTVLVTITTVDGGYILTKTINVVPKSCEQDPNQTECIHEYLGDTSRIVTLPNENISGTNYKEIFYNNRIYYEIYVRTFADSDNNSIGDFQGIIDNLTYLKSLGVGGLWLMPIMLSSSDHGYNVDDYYDVDFEYGTMLDFKELVSAAELVGIDIIIDLVVNHMGAHNEIFQDVLQNGFYSLYYDWFTWIDNNDPRYQTTGSWGQQIWWSPVSRPWLLNTATSVHASLNGKYYAAYFSDWMPDLNFLNQDVKEYINEVAEWWITETGVQGFRMDAIAHIFGHNEYLGITDTHQANIDYLTSFKNHCLTIDSEIYIVGEAWESFDIYSRYYESGINTFNFELSYRIVDAINGNLGNGFSSSIQQIYSEIEKYTSDYIDAPFLRNHDQDRIATVFDGYPNKLRMSAEVLLFLPGNPYIYYGDELGLLGTRTNMIWGTYYDTISTAFIDRNLDTVSEQLTDSSSLLNTYINIGETRNESLALMYGDFVPYINSNIGGFYRIFEQGDDKELVVVLFNFSSIYYKPIPSIFSNYEILYSSYSSDFGGISPKGTMVLKLPYDLKNLLIN